MLVVIEQKPLSHPTRMTTAAPPALPVVQALRRPEDTPTNGSGGGIALLTDAVDLLVRLRDAFLASELSSSGDGEEEGRVGRLLVAEDARGR